jgi:hypothetical protein
MAPAAFAQVSLTIDDGYVTLSAKDTTVRQILAEWARVGRTTIVNGERVGGGPVTLQLIKVPEAEALDIVLRSVAGYMAAPRAVEAVDGSAFDRILVLPSSVAPRAASTSTPAPPAFQPPPMPEDMANMDDPEMVNPTFGPQRPPAFPPFPGGGQPPLPGPGQEFNGRFPGNTQGPTPNAPLQGFAPFTPPGQVPVGSVPAGVSRPGMMVAPPQIAPGIPANPDR